MPDRLYLSYTIRGFTAMNMLRHFDLLLRAFPFSKLSKSESTLRVYAVAFSEPPLIEAAFPPPVDADAVLGGAKEFQNIDSCYELETTWDLWRWDGDWKLGPHNVILSCFGPEFEHDAGDDIHVDFGLEDAFLPRSEGDAGIAMVRANVQSLLRLVHDLDERLAVQNRRLWSESGENFAEKLQRALQNIEP